MTAVELEPLTQTAPEQPADADDARPVLVTGGTGFIGPKVVRALRARELPVRALVRRRARARDLESWGCEIVEGDVTDALAVRRAVDGCGSVVHLVAIRQGRREEFERVMTQATRDLVAAARDSGVERFVLMSALGTSEQTKDLVPYYEAKWQMEEAVRSSGLEHVVFRPSFVFGREGGLLPMFIRLTRFTPVTPVVGSGERRLQPIWVDDVAEFFARALQHTGVTNRTWELGGPEAVTWNELYARIKRVLGIRRPTAQIPIGLMRAQAAVVERLPGNIPLTRDLLTMLEAGDNTTDVTPAIAAFGLSLVPLDDQIRRAA